MEKEKLEKNLEKYKQILYAYYRKELIKFYLLERRYSVCLIILKT